MRAKFYSYRYAREILEHETYRDAWDEITRVLKEAPLFVYAGKSRRNSTLDIVQQVMNTYFDRCLAVDLDWEYQPLATRIQNSGLRADFRKEFTGLTIQVEVQFGNMSRWYSDIFKFQTAYSQNLIQMGLCVVPTGVLARRIDSNIVNFERTVRELPSAELSISLPILLAGIEPDENTRVVNLQECQFESIGDITGKGKHDNRWRIVNAYLSGTPMSQVGPESALGPMAP